MFLTVEILVKKVMANGGRVGRPEGKEARNKMAIIVTILRNIRKQNHRERSNIPTSPFGHDHRYIEGVG